MIFNETHSSLNTSVIHCACGQATRMYVAMMLKMANHMKLATSDPLISSFNTITRDAIPYEDVLLGVTPVVGSPPHRTLDSVAHNYSLLQCTLL